MLLTCKHVYVYSGDRCGLIVRGISHQCQCFYSWIAFACLYQVLRSLNISGLPIMLSCGIALSALHRQRLRVYSCCNPGFYSFDGVFILLRMLVVVFFCVSLLYLCYAFDCLGFHVCFVFLFWFFFCFFCFYFVCIVIRQWCVRHAYVVSACKKYVCGVFFVQGVCCYEHYVCLLLLHRFQGIAWIGCLCVREFTAVFFIDECACLFIALLACISAQGRLYGIVRAYGSL